MINEKRLLDNFFNLVKIDSPSRYERKLADYLIERLQKLGFSVIEDNANERLQSDTGNLIGRLPASAGKNGDQNVGNNSSPILFCAHMDTVVSNKGVQPKKYGDLITTDGKTILGADDKAGIAAFLEAVEIIKDISLPHQEIEVVFTVAEEEGLYGAKYLDYSQIKSQIAFVLDSGGPPGTIVVSAPSEEDFEINIHGKSAHSGVNPQEGINSIIVASLAINRLGWGRIDEETTTNIGRINGGKAVNIVPDLVSIVGEVRSNNNNKLIGQLRRIKQTFISTADEFGAKIDFYSQRAYDSFTLNEDEEVVLLAVEAVKDIGLQPKLQSRGGGSDTNIFNSHGLKSVNMGIGVNKGHTNQENIRIDDLKKTTELVISIINKSTNMTVKPSPASTEVLFP